MCECCGNNTGPEAQIAFLERYLNRLYAQGKDNPQVQEEIKKTKRLLQTLRVENQET